MSRTTSSTPARSDAPAPQPHDGGALRAPIRGVRGLVFDARTRAPIAGAWVTWARPDPWVCQQYGGTPALALEFGALTDRDGRFQLERWPGEDVVPPWLSAVAAGHGVAARRPGLGEEVVFELEPAGTLDVLLRRRWRDPDDEVGAIFFGPEPDRKVTLERDDGRLPEPLSLSSRWGVQRVGDGLRWRTENLPPGRYRLRLDGVEAAMTTVEAGREVAVEVDGWHDVDGVVQGWPPSRAGRLWLIAEGAGWGEAIVVVLDGGRLSASLVPGRYVGYLEALGLDRSRRRVEHPIEVRPGTPLIVEAPDEGARVELLLSRGGEPLQDVDVTLVSLDEPEHDPGVGSSIALASSTGGLHVGSAPPGRYALRVDGAWAGFVELPAHATSLRVDLPAARECRLDLELPTALLPDETLRTRFALLPDELAARPAHRRLAEDAVHLRFAATDALDFFLRRGDACVPLPVAAPGRYLLIGKSDLGVVAAFVDLAPGAELTVSLPW